MFVALTLGFTVALHLALMFVGRFMVNAERARISSNITALSAIYGGMPQAELTAKLNHSSLCGYRTNQESIVVCSEVIGVQRWAKAADSWQTTLPTLEE